MRVSQTNGPVKNMKCKFLLSCLMLSVGVARVNATSDFYVNDGLVLCPPQLPPQVDATNFVNNNIFTINFTNLALVPQLYETASTRNFTNTGVMVGNSGFRFDTAPVGAGTHSMASSFHNSGTISAGSAANTNFINNLLFFTTGLPKLLISATNVSMRSSTNIVGVDGLFSVKGRNLDLNRANISMEGFDTTQDSLFLTTSLPGMTAGYWGIGTNIINPVGSFEIPPPQSPFSLVQYPGGLFGFQVLSLPAAKFYVDETFAGTNRFVQAVFLNNTNASIQNNVYFPFQGFSVVEWVSPYTNPVSGEITTNRLYLTDDFGTLGTNTTFVNFSYYSAVGTQIPANYTFTRFNPFFNLGGAFPVSSPAGVFDPVAVTNEYAAFQGQFTPTTVSLSNLPPAGRYLTNLPGRIEITADDNLDMSFARIGGLNYLGLKATNNISGFGGAKISVPYSDISLKATNGNMTITNLLSPTVPRFIGQVDLWSGRWTNDFGGFRTIYAVLFVDSHLAGSAPALIQDLTLRSTNVVISDVLNVTRNLLIEAERITVESNQPPALIPTGEINLQSSAITWPGSTPRLQYLTNSGTITALNSVFFGGSRFSPFFTSNYNEPYLAFVNRGRVSTAGSLIWADYFENSGSFDTGIGFGSISLQSVDTRLTNGSFLAVNGDISITTGSLSVTNHLLQAGRKLSLAVTNALTDTGSSNANAWVVGRGFDLPVKPLTGDLLGTTITDTAPAGIENTHSVAGEDRGSVVAGFSNNLAIGRVILDGRGAESAFYFSGANSGNAVYVDQLDLLNYATNINLSGNATALDFAPNVKLYYGQAYAGGISVAERLNNANGGRLVWVSGYAGIYSGTNVVYPDGSTNRLNAALVLSQNEDSDGDGLANVADPSPLLLVTTASLPPATNGAAYSAVLVRGGGVAPFTWSLVSGSLPSGLELSAGGVISGTPGQSGDFNIRVRVSQTTLGLFAERDLVVSVQPAPLLLSVAIVHHSPPGAEVGWNTVPNSTNYVYFRNSMLTGNWQLLTNFVSASGGFVSVWDPVGTNQSRYYRVQVTAPQF